MSRERTVPPVLRLPTHTAPEGKNCIVMTECLIGTVTLDEGSFTAIVHSLPEQDLACVAILDHDEVEQHIALLRKSVDDARDMDARKAVHVLNGAGRNATERQIREAEDALDHMLKRAEVRRGDIGGMAAIVHEAVPGWAWRDASAIGQVAARVTLTIFDPDSPL